MNLISLSKLSTKKFHHNKCKKFCAFVPLCLSSLHFVRSALDGFFVSTTDSFKDKPSIMFTKEIFSCSALTTATLRLSGEICCTASLLRCSSSRFLNTKKSRQIWSWLTGLSEMHRLESRNPGGKIMWRVCF